MWGVYRILIMLIQIFIANNFDTCQSCHTWHLSLLYTDLFSQLIKRALHRVGLPAKHWQQPWERK